MTYKLTIPMEYALALVEDAIRSDYNVNSEIKVKKGSGRLLYSGIDDETEAISVEFDLE